MPSSTATDVILFALSALVGLALQKKASAAASPSDASCDAKLLNSAFVFVKPHANTEATQELVKRKLTDAGISILEEKDIDGASLIDPSCSLLDELFA